MATVVNTGQTLTLTVNAISRSNQITSATLTPSPVRNRYKLIGGTETQKVVDTTYVLTCDVILDWSSGTTDFCDTLWTAYTTSPDTAIAFVLASNGQTFTGNLYPELPPVGGSSSDAHTWSATFQLDGIPTKS
jgi:hypothetical protein